MSDADGTPDASADARDRAAATEGYGGVPISDEELAQVWTTSESDDAAAAETVRSEAGSSEPVEPAGPAAGGEVKPEVPARDPAPTEPP